MKYYMPVTVFDEPDCVRAHAKELARLGNKALIVTGKHSADACGAFADTAAALDSMNIPYCRYSGIEENPSVETVVKAAEYGRSEHADFVIGIGGGSPMDAAKAIAFLMKQETISAAPLYDASLPAEALPVAAVPTTCGTGSEVTGVSVLTVHEKKTKQSIPHRIFPVLALIDGKYLCSASHAMIVSTSVDALAHMVESRLHAKANDYSIAAVNAGLSLWKNIRPVLSGEAEPTDSDRTLLMRSAAFGGIAIAQTGTSIPHALSYILTYDDGIAHGKACGYFLPAFLKEAPAELQKEILALTGFNGIDEFSAFMHSLYADLSPAKETLDRAYTTLSANAARLASACFPVDPEMLHRIVYGTEKEG